ncbi:HemK2/MTQ2 family protein methyltransferase [Methanobacterium sp.]|uniref:HemK2/MTQ2 family protein methyltransferase n=1 Tax=Methanobacterium sp. TaxID=2164 RepID=UPI003C77C784
MIKYQGMEFQTCEKVYEPAEDTFLLAENLKVKKTDRVLEIGTGTGIIAVITSKITENVIAVDINEYAVECARKNAKINQSDIDIRLGDLFDSVEDEKFDLILFNTPYLPTGEDERIDDELEVAWDGGADGRLVIDRFIEQLPAHLSPKGRVQLVQSSLSNIEETTGRLMEKSFDVSITASERFFFEEVVVLTAKLT